MKRSFNTPDFLSLYADKSKHLKLFLKAVSELKPISKAILKELAYRFGVMPEHLYILIKEFGGACHG